MSDQATIRRTLDEFSRVYAECVEDVLRLMPNDWSTFSEHNSGWRKGRFDPRQYLADSRTRYVHALRALLQDGAQSILDVGGFLAAFPLALRRLGLQVAIAEHYGYYDKALDAIAEHLQHEGVSVIDADFTEPLASPDHVRMQFDGVTCMAVAEHLAHSPKPLMRNIRRALRPSGTLVFEVPNLAFWPRRFAFFVRGRTVLSPIEDVYHSAIPFTGHHREYTLDDARYVVAQEGFTIVAEHMFNYSLHLRDPLQWVKFAPAVLLREWAEVILLHCRKPDPHA